MNKRNIDKLLSEALSLSEDGNHEEAKRKLILATKIDPNSIEARSYLASQYFELKDYEQAGKEYQKLCQLVPRNIFCLIQMGLSYYYVKKFNKSEETFRKLIHIDKKLAVGHNNLGYILIQKGNYKEASKHLIKAAKIKPEQVTICNLGFIALMARRFDVAYKFYTTVINQKPIGDAILNLAYLKGDRLIKMETYGSISATAYYNLATIDAIRKRIKLAFDNLEKALKVNKEFYIAQLSEGWLYFNQGNISKSLECFARAFHFPDNLSDQASAKELNELRTLFTSILSDQNIQAIREGRPESPQSVGRIELPESRVQEETKPSLPEIIETEYPFPVAFSYVRMVDERIPDRQLRGLFRSFENLLKYFAIAIISDIKNIIPELYKKVGDEYLKKPGGMSLGDWRGVIHRVLKECRERKKIDKLFMPEILNFSKKKQMQKIFDFLCKKRSDIEGHPGALPSLSLCEKLYKNCKHELDSILEEASFLKNYNLLFIENTSILEKCYCYETKVFKGANPCFKSSKLNCNVRIVTDRCFLMKNEEDILDLYPLLLYNTPEEGEDKEVLLFDKFDKGRLCYRSCQSTRLYFTGV